MALATYARTMELVRIDYATIHQENGKMFRNFLKPRKTQLQGTLPRFYVEEFKDDPHVCPVESMRSYLNKTDQLGGSTLLTSILSPHNAIGTLTIARRLKLILKLMDVDVSVFLAHSGRGSAASRAF